MNLETKKEVEAFLEKLKTQTYLLEARIKEFKWLVCDFGETEGERFRNQTQATGETIKKIENLAREWPDIKKKIQGGQQ